MNIKMLTIKEGAGVFLHCKRQHGEMYKYNNQEIDTCRSHLNSIMKTLPEALDGKKISFPDDYYSAVNGYLEESRRITGKKVSKNAKCVVAIVVTMPRQYCPPEGADFEEWYTEKRMNKENLFYLKVVHFFLKKFGHYNKKLGPNFLCATVHRDETTSHCHILFVPRVKDTYNYNKIYTRNGKKEFRKITVKAGSISAWNVVSKNVLKGLHQELDAFLRDEIAWYDGGVLLPVEERMLPGQNLDWKDLKKAGKDYAERRAKSNRLAFIEEEKSLNVEALSAIKDEYPQASLILFVDRLIQQGKMTEEDFREDPEFEKVYSIYQAFMKKRTEIAKALRYSLDNSGKPRISVNDMS